MCLCSSFMLVIVKCFMFLILYEFCGGMCWTTAQLACHEWRMYRAFTPTIPNQTKTYIPKNLFTHIYNELTSIIPLHTLCICLDLTVFSGFFFSFSFFLFNDVYWECSPKKKLRFFSVHLLRTWIVTKSTIFFAISLKRETSKRNKCSQITIIPN